MVDVGTKSIIWVHLEFKIYLVGGIPTPLKNMKVSRDDDIPKIWKVIKVMFQTTTPLWGVEYEWGMRFTTTIPGGDTHLGLAHWLPCSSLPTSVRRASFEKTAAENHGVLG